MRSPWIDLLFLHGHITPTQVGHLAWRPEAPHGDKQAPVMKIDVAELPLRSPPQKDSAYCA